MGTINHRHVTTLPDNPNADISSDEWNDALVIRGTDADGFVLTRDATQPDGWRFAPLPTVDLSGVVPITRTVNAHPLSADVVVTKADVGLGNVENTALSTWSGSTSITTIGTLTDHLSIGTNSAATGAIRLANGQSISWRNAANDGDLIGISIIAGNHFRLFNNTWGIEPINGNFLPVTGNVTDIGSTVNRIRNLYLSSSVVNKVKAGTPVDADVVSPADGMMVLDSTANKIWVRLGGAWKGVAVT